MFFFSFSSHSQDVDIAKGKYKAAYLAYNANPETNPAKFHRNKLSEL